MAKSKTVLPKLLIICPNCHNESHIVTEEDYNIIVYGSYPKFTCSRCNHVVENLTLGHLTKAENSEW